MTTRGAMAELRRDVVEQLKTDVATCLAMLKAQEERRAERQEVRQQERQDRERLSHAVQSLEHLVIQLHGRLERLEADHEQLDHVVQTPNGNDPLTTLVDRNVQAITDLQAWRAKHDPLIIALETSKIQQRGALAVAQTQGWSARYVALITVTGSVVTALVTALVLWWLTGQPTPPKGP